MGRLQYILDRAFAQAPQDFEEPELSTGWHRGLSARFRHSEILRLVHPQVKRWMRCLLAEQEHRRRVARPFAFVVKAGGSSLSQRETAMRRQ
jgi:hypothetical protein